MIKQNYQLSWSKRHLQSNREVINHKDYVYGLLVPEGFAGTIEVLVNGLPIEAMTFSKAKKAVVVPFRQNGVWVADAIAMVIKGAEGLLLLCANTNMHAYPADVIPVGVGYQLYSERELDLPCTSRTEIEGTCLSMVNCTFTIKRNQPVVIGNAAEYMAAVNASELGLVPCPAALGDATATKTGLSELKDWEKRLEAYKARLDEKNEVIAMTKRAMENERALWLEARVAKMDARDREQNARQAAMDTEAQRVVDMDIRNRTAQGCLDQRQHEMREHMTEVMARETAVKETEEAQEGRDERYDLHAKRQEERGEKLDGLEKALDSIDGDQCRRAQRQDEREERQDERADKLYEEAVALDERVEAFAIVVTARTAALDERRNELERCEAGLDRREKEWRDRKEAMDEREDALTRREKDEKAMKEALQGKSDVLDQLEAKMDEKTKALEEYKQRLTAEDLSLKAEDVRLFEIKKLTADVCGRQTEKETELDDRDHLLAEWKTTLEQHAAQLNEREASVVRREAMLEEISAQVDKKLDAASVVEAREKACAVEEERLNFRGHAMNHREVDLDKRDSELDEEMALHKKVIDAAQQKIDVRAAELDVRDRMLTDCQETLDRAAVKLNADLDAVAVREADAKKEKAALADLKAEVKKEGDHHIAQEKKHYVEKAALEELRGALKGREADMNVHYQWREVKVKEDIAQLESDKEDHRQALNLLQAQKRDFHTDRTAFEAKEETRRTALTEKEAELTQRAEALDQDRDNLEGQQRDWARDRADTNCKEKELALQRTQLEVASTNMVRAHEARENQLALERRELEIERQVLEKLVVSKQDLWLAQDRALKAAVAALDEKYAAAENVDKPEEWEDVTADE